MSFLRTIHLLDNDLAQAISISRTLDIFGRAPTLELWASSGSLLAHERMRQVQVLNLEE